MVSAECCATKAGWANPKVIAILAVVFLCGSVLGAAADAALSASSGSICLRGGTSVVYTGKRVDFNTLKHTLNLTAARNRQ